MLEDDRLDFYFADKSRLGYINRLDFRTDGEVLEMEDHPLHMDLVKVKLNTPLPPGSSIPINTPFHVKVPWNFSGVGYSRGKYLMRFWYPAPALYENGAWQLNPYTGQTVSSAQPADYELRLTVHRKYGVEAMGSLVDSTAAADSVKTVYYRASDAGDMSWYAYDPRFPEVKEKTPMPLSGLSEKIPPFIFSHRYLPAVGYNVYDGLQVGLATHNFDYPKKNLTYFFAGMYGLNSRNFTGLGGMSYQWRPAKAFRSAEIGVEAAAFSNLDGVDSSGGNVFGSFSKIAPYFRLSLPTASGKTEKWIELRTFVISERGFGYSRFSGDSLFYPSLASAETRYLNQLSFHYERFRALYPYDLRVQLQQAANFYRLNATLNYFFNYAGGGGLRMRLFAAKFGYIGSLSSAERFETVRYQPKLTAVRGYEDYTYSNPFLGRNEFEGLGSKQIMMRDGGLKLRTDIFQDLQGRSDNWVASINLNTTLPASLVPPAFPLRLFLDAGSYAGAWKEGTASSRFMYVAGFQLSLFRDLLHVYAPVLFSRELRDNLKSVPEEHKFFNRLSFSIDVHRFSWRRFSRGALAVKETRR